MAAVALLACLCCGCTSTDYLRQRCSDAGDIVTAQFGYGLGAKARVGPIHTGASWIFTPFGLSNGELYSGAMTEETCPADVEVLFTGMEYSPCGQERNKHYRAGWGWPFIAWPEEVGGDGSALWPHPYYTEVRVAAGLIPAAVLGLNPGELVDFVVGWLGIDVYRDD
jgi:hypothetical protein